MIGFLVFIHTLVSILLIGLILMQSSQGGGLSGTFGGNAASSVLGGQNAGNVLSKITTWLASFFIILAIIISVVSGPTNESNTSLVKNAANERGSIDDIDFNESSQEAVLDLEEETK